MKKNGKKIRKKAGLPPGSVIFTGNRKAEKVFIHHLQYNISEFKADQYSNHADIIFPPSHEEKLNWYDIRGLHDTSIIELLGKTFQIHSLVLEDIADVHQRPKFDEYNNGVFITIRAFIFDTPTLEVKTEQVSLFFRKGLLFSFQERESDLFEAVRLRIESGKGRIRTRGSDYLAYALLDNIVDSYYLVFDEIEEVIETFEDELLARPDVSIKNRIHTLKKELLLIRKSVSPLREAIGRFSKSENPLVDASSAIYLRDLYDHTIQIMDMVESYRDLLNGLQDLYLSEISFKMNQVMQVLTIITTVFVPLSFLAGLYGMNFQYMPELGYRYSYFILLGVMFLIFIASVLFFRNKRWI